MRRYLLVSAVVIMISILMLVDMANAASPVTSGLKAWFKADALNLNDSDPVSTWTDSSGNSNNITQSTPSYRPVYYTNVLNGLPGVYFNGFFGRNSLENQDTATLASTQLTIFMVVAPSDYQIWGTPLAILSRAGGVIAPQQATIGWQENFARFTHYSGSTSGQSYLDHLDASTTNGVWNPCIVECTTNMQSANLMTYWNGIPSIDSVTLIGSPTSYTAVNRSIIMGWVGGDGSNFNGYICETLIYNRKLSDYERNVVGVYLAEKYDLTTSYANVSPQPVTADLKAWFKADALNLNNNDSVTTWNDSSGNGNNITQGTSTNRPVYNTNVLNGHPGVYFSGFTTRKSLENQDTATLASKEFTIYAVLAPSASYQVWGIPLTLLYRGGGTNNPQQASVGWQENFPRLTHYSGSSSGQCYLDHQNASNVWSPCIVECLAGTQPADLTT